MAVELNQEDVLKLIGSELKPTVRYRSLVIQSSDLLQLIALADFVSSAALTLGPDPKVFGYTEFFDEIGAISCSEVWERIQAAAAVYPVILTGPLHFLDYWSEPTRDVFWRALASFSSGPGIIAIDAPRNEGIDGPFRLAGKVGESDVRLLRSRLSLSQDRVA